MRIKHLAISFFTAALMAVPWGVHAADDKAQDYPVPAPANQQVIVPQVDRRDVKVPHIPSDDIELGVFAGTYASQNFGTSRVTGVRLGYHITEDFFVEGVYGRTKVSDEAFRKVLPAGLFEQPTLRLNYYNISAGVNLLPGEVFFWRNSAKPSTLYFIAGVGNTKFNKESLQTYNAGFGLRVFFASWAAMQVDMRDHFYSVDLLGTRQSTQNLELTLGATFFF